MNIPSIHHYGISLLYQTCFTIKMVVFAVYLCQSAPTYTGTIAVQKEDGGSLTLENCNDLMQYLLDNPSYIQTSITELFANTNADIQARLSDSTVRFEALTTSEEKSKIHQLLFQDSTQMPRTQLVTKLNAMRAYIKAGLAEAPADIRVSLLPDFESLLNDESIQALALMPSYGYHYNLQSCKDYKPAISFEELQELIIAQIMRCLILAHQHAKDYNPPLLHARLAAEMVQSLVYATAALAIDLWLTEPYSRSTWDHLFNAQYQAWAKIVPLACRVIIACR